MKLDFFFQNCLTICFIELVVFLKYFRYPINMYFQILLDFQMPNFLVNENYKHTNLCFVHWIGLHFTKQAQLSRFLSTYCSYNIKCHYRSKCGERRILPWTSRVAQVDTNFFIRNNAVMWYVLLWNKYGYESSESDTKIKTIIRIRYMSCVYNWFKLKFG